MPWHALFRKTAGKLECWTGEEWTSQHGKALWTTTAWEALSMRHETGDTQAYIVTRFDEPEKEETA